MTLLKRISGWLNKASTGWISLAGMLIFLVFSATVLPSQASKAEAANNDTGSPDLSFFYSVADLYKMAEAYGKDGRTSYIRARFSFDLIFPLVYTTFLTTWISWTFQRAFSQDNNWQLANLTPLLGMGFDFLENVSTSVVMAHYPAQSPGIDWLATAFTPLKWIFIGGSFILLLTGTFLAILGWMKSRVYDQDKG
jgi:hypothetical protein